MNFKFCRNSQLMQANFFTKLDSYGVLKVSGTNAPNFLQGALTCNVDYINNNCGIGARCNAKGRVTAIFYLFTVSDCWYLLTPQSLLTDLQQDLAKYALFAKVKVEIADNLVIFGGLGDDLVNKRELNQQHNVNFVHLTHGRFVVIGNKNDDKFSFLLTQTHEMQDLNAWNLSQIQDGIAQIEKIHHEQFVPQMLNLPAIGAVSFKKGCYMGQEIVARMQFLGATKRQMYRFGADCPAPNIGTNLLSEDASAVGEIILSANTPNGCEFLAVLEQKALAHNIYVDNHRVNLLKLPYVVDKDAEILR